MPGAIEEQDWTASTAVKSALGEVLYVGDQLGKVRLLVSAGALSEQDAASTLGLLDSAMDCFAALNDGVLI